MPLPDRLLPLSVVLVRPVEAVDRYGNTTYDYGPAATRTTVRAHIDQRVRSEPIADGRDPAVGDWLMFTNHTDLAARDRVEWDGELFEVVGPPWPVVTPVGVHHVEATLRAVEG